LSFVVVLSTDCPPLLPPIFPPIKEAGFCTMYGGNCDVPSHQHVNCLNNTRAVKPSFPMPSCPEFSSSSCCDQSQYSLLEENLGKAMNLFGACPGCYDNFRQLWCQFTCSPDQSVFIDVTNATTGSLGLQVVTALNFALSDEYSQNLWNSCDNVQFARTGYPVVKLLFGASTALQFLCYQGVPEPAGSSPIEINFEISNWNSLSNTSLQRSCQQMVNGKACLCTDCPAVCPNPCASNPCEYGGVCEVNPFDFSYSCFCPHGYAGDHCQCSMTCPSKVNARPDCNLQCGDHGRCRFLDDGTPICYCDQQWMGDQCQFDRSKF